ncbi:MAG TPA: hypothetical protein VMW10_10330 [Alphaproteobacteria bacterium]|nr:hypothetical protein [Alphaproteobacteria bacterium]
MFKYYLLIGLSLIITSPLAWANMRPSDNLIRSEVPAKLTIYYHNHGIGTNTIQAGRAIHVIGDIDKLHVAPMGTHKSMKPVMCDGVYSNAIDIGVKKGSKNEIECN